MAWATELATRRRYIFEGWRLRSYPHACIRLNKQTLKLRNNCTWHTADRIHGFVYARRDSHQFHQFQRVYLIRLHIQNVRNSRQSKKPHQLQNELLTPWANEAKSKKKKKNTQGGNLNKIITKIVDKQKMERSSYAQIRLLTGLRQPSTAIVIAPASRPASHRLRGSQFSVKV